MPRATDGNLARKLEGHEYEHRLEKNGRPDFDQRYYHSQETAMERRSRQRAAAKAAVRSMPKLSPAVVAGFAATAAMMVVILLCYVQLNAISRHIVEMKEDIQKLEVEHVSLLTRYEQAFDLTTVKAAAEQAGMTQPSDSQIYYIDLPGEDQVVSYGDDDLDLITRFTDKVKKKFAEVVEYFRQ